MSGMTLRRWESLPDQDRIPELYEKAFYEVVYELLAEGSLRQDSEVAEIVLKESDQTVFSAAIKNLGFTADFMKDTKKIDSTSIIEGIAQIGAHKSKQDSVTLSKTKIFSFIKLGAEWKHRIKTLYTVVTSKKVTPLDKFAAYGALFYLLTPFDLIPDNIPVFGLMDDYFILGLVTVYYIKRFPELFKSQDV